MPATLPTVIAAYFDAANRHESAAVAACFTPDAVVTDERQQHRGRAAIAEWERATSSKYQVSLAPRELGRDAGGYRVVASASGNFPGSPLDLHFQFSLAGDAIRTLEITV